MNQTAHNPNNLESLNVEIKDDLVTAVVAGGAGFIGSHLCSALVLQNCRVIAFDNLLTGSKDNINALEKKDNFTFIQADLKNPFKLDLKKVDYIFHLAGSHYYPNNKKAQEELLLVNSEGTKNLLELAHNTKAKFLLGSSPQIYAGYISHKSLDSYYGKKAKNEQHKLLEAKRFAEGLVQQYFKEKDLDSRIIRYLDIYGPSMDLNKSTIIGSLLEDFKNDDLLQIPGDGLQKLYPTYISDLVYGLIKAMFSSGTKGKVYTLANPKSTTTLNLAFTLKKFKGLKVEYVEDWEKTHYPIDEESLNNSQKDLAWQAKVNLEEGLEKTIDSFLNKGLEQEGLDEKELPAAIQANIIDVKEIKNKKTKEKKVADQKQEISSQDFKMSRAIDLEKEDKKESKTDERLLEENKNKDGSNLEIKTVVIEKDNKLGALFRKFKKVKKSKESKDGKEGGEEENKKEDENNKKIKTKTKKKLKKRSKFFLLLFSIFLLLFLPFLICGVQLFIVKNRFFKLEKNLRAWQFEEVKEQAPKVLSLLNKTQTSWRFFSPYFYALGLSDEVEQLYELMLVAKNSSELALETSQTAENFDRFVATVLQGKKGDPKKDQQQLNLNLKNIYQKLSLLESQLKTLSVSKIIQQIKFDDVLNEYKKTLPVLRKKLYLAQELNPILPEILGFSKKKTYLVLLQNNMELRPTGGFIGSFALVTFDKGRMLDWQVLDVYDADGQLRGHVEPPASLKKHLGEANWYLRDSNWDPDFLISSKRAEWFLEKELGKTVDGTIGINLQTVQNLLKAIGPVAVTDYNELIDKDNIFERAEYHAEVNFFPGSTQKKDFLGALSTTILEKIKSLEKEKWPSLTDELFNSLDNKALLFSLHDSHSAKIMARYAWDGSLVTNPKTFINSNYLLDYSDYLMLVDTNVGINKTNYFLNREASLKSTILKDGRQEKELSLFYKNNSLSESWPGGKYKNYWRIILSKNNRIKSLKIGETVNKLEEVDLKTLDYEDLGDKVLYGYYFKVPVQEKRVLLVTYIDELKKDFQKNKYNIGFYWQKQAGVVDDKISFEFNYPLFFKVSRISPQGDVGTQKALFKTDLLKDREFYIELSK